MNACATAPAPLPAARRAEDDLTERDRTTARALRRAAAVVAAAGLPADYRTTAYAIVAPRMIDRAQLERLLP